MTLVAHFVYVYGSEFNNGRIGWRWFWALLHRIPQVFARQQLEDIQSGAIGHAMANGSKMADVVRDIERVAFYGVK